MRKRSNEPRDNREADFYSELTHNDNERAARETNIKIEIVVGTKRDDETRGSRERAGYCTNNRRNLKTGKQNDDVDNIDNISTEQEPKQMP